MKTSTVTRGTRSDDGPLVEVLDRDFGILAVLPLADVRRQQLRHNSVIVLLYDEAGRLLLRKEPSAAGGGRLRWDLPAKGPVHAGESLHDAATRTLHESLGIHAERLKQVQVVPPAPENGNERQHVYSVVRPEGGGTAAAKGESYPFSRDELGCLLRDFGELVSTRLLILAQSVQLTPKLRPPA